MDLWPMRIDAGVLLGSVRLALRFSGSTDHEALPI